MLITGNIPFDTQVASVYIFGRIESDNTTAAAAVAVLLLDLGSDALPHQPLRPLEESP